MPNDIDGPHGVAVAPDGGSYFVTFAHGQPNGTLWRLATSDDRPLGHVTLGMFPATAAGDPRRRVRVRRRTSTCTAIACPRRCRSWPPTAMLEVARIPTCLMPHGSRLNAQGTKHYSACMMDDTLVEIDTRRLKVARHFTVTEGGKPAAPGRRRRRDRRRTSRTRRPRRRAAAPGSTACSPTWAQPSADGRRVFVACNGSSEIVEIDVRRGRCRAACRPDPASTTSPSRATAGACWRPTAAGSRSR